VRKLGENGQYNCAMVVEAPRISSPTVSPLRAASPPLGFSSQLAHLLDVPKKNFAASVTFAPED
jgi:hypothetical protein